MGIIAVTLLLAALLAAVLSPASAAPYVDAPADFASSRTLSDGRVAFEMSSAPFAGAIDPAVPTSAVLSFKSKGIFKANVRVFQAEKVVPEVGLDDDGKTRGLMCLDTPTSKTKKTLLLLRQPSQDFVDHLRTNFDAISGEAVDTSKKSVIFAHPRFRCFGQPVIRTITAVKEMTSDNCTLITETLDYADVFDELQLDAEVFHNELVPDLHYDELLDVKTVRRRARENAPVGVSATAVPPATWRVSAGDQLDDASGVVRHGRLQPLSRRRAWRVQDQGQGFSS
jgi:hypothetical protein